MRNFLLFFTYCILLLSCRSDENVLVFRNNQVTIFLDKPMINIIMRTVSGSTIALGRQGEELSIIDTNYHYQQLKINYEPFDDTVRLKLNRDKVQLNVRHMVFNELNLLFLKGDSVKIKYDSTRLAYATVLNRITKPWDINYDRYVISTFYKYGYSSLLRILHPFVLVKNENLTAKDSSDLVKSARVELDRENGLLDSIYKSDGISKEYFEFYKTRNSFRIEILNLISTKNYVRPLWTKDSSNFEHQYYRDFMFHFLDKNLEENVPFVITTNSKIRDYRIAFEKVVVSSELTTLEKDIILFNYLEQIITYFSKSDIEKFLKRFTEVAQNKKLAGVIKSSYNLDFNTSTELYLKNSNEKTTTFKSILETYRGKLVYIDFWASWCSPCIASMPASVKLREEFKDKPVVFIYLSKDEEYEAWIRSAGKYNLLIPASFIIQNQYTSNMLEELEIKSIPRYLLYDQSGNLIHKNAPGPEGQEIRKLFTSLLNKEKIVNRPIK